MAKTTKKVTPELKESAHKFAESIVANHSQHTVYDATTIKNIVENAWAMAHAFSISATESE